MKNLLLTFTFLFSFLSYAQKLEIDKETGKYTITGVSNITGLNKEKLFDELYSYVVLNFSKLAFMNEYNLMATKQVDNTNYQINNLLVETKGDAYSIFLDISKPSSLFSGTNHIHFSMLLEIKNEKFRYTFRNFVFNTNHFELKSFIGKETILEDTEFYIGSLIIRLERACKSNEDW